MKSSSKEMMGMSALSSVSANISADDPSEMTLKLKGLEADNSTLQENVSCNFILLRERILWSLQCNLLISRHVKDIKS